MKNRTADKPVMASQLLEGVLAAHGPERTWVAWTGGKDSTLALWLWLQALHACGAGPAQAISIDTGRKFPEVMVFRDTLATRWGVRVEVVRPEVPRHLPENYPIAVDKVDCCSRLKVAPLKEAIARLGVGALITGIRRDEHPSRANRQPLEQRTDPPHTLVNPLLDFTEMDVWSATAGHEIPYCNLYDAGYRSLGCMDCTTLDGVADAHEAGERAGRHPDKERQLAQLTSLGYF